MEKQGLKLLCQWGAQDFQVYFTLRQNRNLLAAMSSEVQHSLSTNSFNEKWRKLRREGRKEDRNNPWFLHFLMKCHFFRSNYEFLKKLRCLIRGRLGSESCSLSWEQILKSRAHFPQCSDCSVQVLTLITTPDCACSSDRKHRFVSPWSVSQE